MEKILHGVSSRSAWSLWIIDQKAIGCLGKSNNRRLRTFFPVELKQLRGPDLYVFENDSKNKLFSMTNELDEVFLYKILTFSILWSFFRD